MLSNRERATLRDIQDQLADDPDFEQFFRARVAAPPRPWQRVACDITAGASGLLGCFLMLIGSFGAAASLFAVAIALGLAGRLGNR
ncbi:DUF3040 domain-containing protein [Amycolatopsis sp. NPDC049691]|uniref:DUF3040 domain-containing protein n=1 Tax=Amycolatopsis sp. NPDC049691 TaxID=3155155 RepID=UPI00341BF7A0